jgi:hypothetical protein
MKIEITSNISQGSRYFKGLQRQIDYAMIKTINDMAFETRADIYSVMGDIFDRPKLWTMRSFYVDKATKQKPEAWVGLKGREYKDPYPRALAHHFIGGERAWKRMEEAFRRMGILPPGTAMMPGDGAPLDQYGNVPVGFIKQMMSYFRVNRDVGTTSNSTAKSRKGIERRLLKKRGGAAQSLHFFIHSDVRGKHLKPGIYQSTRYGRTSEVEPIFIFTKKPRYQRRIFLEEIAAGIVAKRGAEAFNNNLAKALSTARF